MSAVFIDLVALVVLVLLFYCLYFGGCWLVGLGMLCGLVVVLLISFTGVVRLDGCDAWRFCGLALIGWLLVFVCVL